MTNETQNIFNIRPRSALESSLESLGHAKPIDLGLTQASKAPATYTLTLDMAEYAMLGGLITETLRQMSDMKTLGEDGQFYVSLPAMLVSIHNKLADLGGTEAIHKGDAA